MEWVVTKSIKIQWKILGRKEVWDKNAKGSTGVVINLSEGDVWYWGCFCLAAVPFKSHILN